MLETNITKIVYRIYVLSINRQIETKDFQSLDILFGLKQSVVTMQWNLPDRAATNIIDKCYCKLDYGTPKNGSVVITKYISCLIILSNKSNSIL